MKNKQILDLLFQNKYLSKNDYICLLDKYCPRNERKVWSQYLVIFGSGFVLAGIVCFFVANWSQLGSFLKLSLSLVGVIGCGLRAYSIGVEKLSAQAFLFGAAVLLGVFWAVFGQVYQIGSGSLASWVICLIPLCFFARNKWLWLMTFYLAVIYWASKDGFIFWATNPFLTCLWLVFGGSAAWAVACWKNTGSLFESFIWVPIGLFVWIKGVVCIISATIGTEDPTAYIPFLGGFWLAQMIVSILRKEVFLFGWSLFGVVGWVSLWFWCVSSNWTLANMAQNCLLSGALCVLAGVVTLLFGRLVREIK